MKRKIAVLADIHGNQTALEAVIADASSEQITDYLVLGDLFLPGPGTKSIMETIKKLHPAIWLKGNWEEAIFECLTGQIDITNPEDIYLTRLSMFLQKQLSSASLQELKNMPIANQIKINGIKIGLSHNQPFRADGRDLYPAEKQANFDQLFDDEQDVAIYAHTHQPLMRTSSKGQLVINPGAVGQPYSSWDKFFADQRASYVILTIDELGRIAVSFRKVDYSIETELGLAKQQNLPYFEIYEYLRKTGKTNTHNQQLLNEINIQNGYLAEVTSYLKRLEK